MSTDSQRQGQRHSGSRWELLFLVVYVFGLSLAANISVVLYSVGLLPSAPSWEESLRNNYNLHLGAEYWNIGQALAGGRGFSDPFGVATGPTAWMPPVYPCVLAYLFVLLGSRELVATAIVLAKNATLVVTGLFILRISRATTQWLPPIVALISYAVWLGAHYFWFFEITHDVWLVLACVDVCLIGAYRLAEQRVATRRNTIAWGLLGSLVFLTSPTTGVGWLVTTAVLAVRRSLRGAMLMAALIGLAGPTAWAVRNGIIFHRPIFVKSNLFYDLYQSNFESKDGVYDRYSFTNHPFWTTRRNPESLYRLEGEAAFIDFYRGRFFDALRQRPGEVAAKVGNRLLAATLVYKPYRPNVEGSQPPLPTLVYPLPFLGLVLVLLLRPPVRHAMVGVTALFYVCCLTPYILAAYYIRYLLPLTPALVLLWVWGLDALVSRVFGGNARHIGPIRREVN